MEYSSILLNIKNMNILKCLIVPTGKTIRFKLYIGNSDGETFGPTLIMGDIRWRRKNIPMNN